MYRVFQFFVLCLKVNIFTEFLVSLFYLIQFARQNGVEEAIKEPDTWLQLVVTIFLLPFLYFARTAGSTESKTRMVVFLVFQVLVIVHFVVILKETLQPENNWYTWIVFSKYSFTFSIKIYLKRHSTSQYGYRH